MNSPTGHVYCGRFFCSRECAINTLEYTPTDEEWRNDGPRIRLPLLLLPVLMCDGCGFTINEIYAERSTIRNGRES